MKVSQNPAKRFHFVSICFNEFHYSQKLIFYLVNLRIIPNFALTEGQKPKASAKVLYPLLSNPQ